MTIDRVIHLVMSLAVESFAYIHDNYCTKAKALLSQKGKKKAKGVLSYESQANSSDNEGGRDSKFEVAPEGQGVTEGWSSASLFTHYQVGC